MAIRDGEPASGFPVSFERFFLAYALSSGKVALGVSSGSCPFAGEEIGLPVAGSGWLLAGESELDESRERSVGSPSCPLPFFRGASGEGRVSVVRATARCELIDAFDLSDSEALKERCFKVQNLSKLRELDSTFPDGTRRTAMVASHLNAASWRLRVPPGAGLRLRRVYDRFHGRQRARVLVNGEPVGVWYTPFEDRLHRWAVSDFGIHASAFGVREEIEIAIDPPPGTPLWSVSRMEMFSVI